ncbi:hypothetical protein [Salinicola avicenniae]|uniref:hypothetical protein n=1 Tax=Salinicola avicenniae TaxID=2916836 RepID=UPI002072B68B|nr:MULTISPECIES: hypothetical protein [unclassified Salinicola]
MAKSKALHWQEPTTEACPKCNGSGEWAGMFSSGPCANCDGTGLVGSDGEPLSTDDLLPMMRRQRDRAVQQCRQLLQTPGVREALAEHRERLAQKERDEHAALKHQLRGR